MFFFNIDLVPFLIFGIFVFIISRFMGNWQIKRYPNSFFSIPIINKIFIVWTARAVGVFAIGVFIYMSIDRPYRMMMKKTENQLVLLEKGQVATGTVAKDSWYDKWAPPAWMILYNFEIEPNSANEEAKVYWGSAYGPKDYYSNFSKGDPVKIIYNPANPKINCELYDFVNYPHYRKTFREAGKLGLLDKFKDEIKVEDYSYMKWYRLSDIK